MHPAFDGRRKVGAYFAAWIPVLGIFVLVLSAVVGWPVALSAALATPLVFVYSFVCLSGWYLCRANPVDSTDWWRIVSAHGAAALAAAGLLAVMARALVRLVGGEPGIEEALLFAMGVLLYLLTVAFHYAALAVEKSRDAERVMLEARLSAREAELKALQARINPHFLFNSLNSISALTSISPERAREMCVLLSDFLRGTLGLGDRAEITLGEELGLTRNYLAIEQARFGSRLRFEQQVESRCEDCLVPPLLLQPLVENAVKHGVSGMSEGGSIRLWARVIGSKIQIGVENDFDPEYTARRKSGMGLKTVRGQLEGRHGAEATMDARRMESSFRVELTLPAERSPSANSNRGR